jgi:hypothetical protein
MRDDLRIEVQREQQRDMQAALIRDCLWNGKLFKQMNWLGPQYFLGIDHQAAWEALSVAERNGNAENDAWAWDVDLAARSEPISRIMPSREGTLDEVIGPGGIAAIRPRFDGPTKLSPKMAAEIARRIDTAYRETYVYDALLRMADEVRTGKVSAAEGLNALNACAPKPRMAGTGAMSAADLIAANQQYRTMLIDGWLREGETMNIIAAPKTGKSWMVLQLVLSMANGMRFLGLQTKQSRVLIVDNELHPETLGRRLAKVSDNMNVDVAGVSVLSLRGRLKPLDAIAPMIVAEAQATGSSVIVLDALYRFLPEGTSENDNAQMAALYNRIDQIAAETGCAVIIIHHSSKGDQSGKGVTDGGSGAGAISRAADCHVLLRPHAEDDHIIIDAVARSWPPRPGFVVRSDHGILYEEPGMDAENYRQPARVKRA